MDELRQSLARLDASSQSVHAAASAMMRHYDQSVIAVNEWRNALQMARGEQLLALLYVANEVLQNSKRNRGRNFLESMSPVLSQALLHICQRDVELVEKVRRVVKIWGDRQIFSMRFVNELLHALNPYREQFQAMTGGQRHQQQQRRSSDSHVPSTNQVAAPPAKATSTGTGERENHEDDDILNILQDQKQERQSDDDASDSGDEDDDDEDVFAQDAAGSQKLQIDLNLDSMAVEATGSRSSSKPAKRRRSVDSSGGGGGSVNSGGSGQGKRRASSLRRKSTLLTDSVSTWQRLQQLQQSFYHSQLALEKIETSLSKVPVKELEDLVGDELQQTFRENTRHRQQVVEQRRLLHEIAAERHSIEQDCLRYLPWLERAVQQDSDDLEFCDQLVGKIRNFQRIHPTLRRAKQQRLEEERQRQIVEEKLAEERRRHEEDQRFREAALAKETEAKPGMVWNPTTREYQALNTDEAWRD
jgi:hypothetical protein